MHLVYCGYTCARGGMLKIGDGCELGVTTLIVMLNLLLLCCVLVEYLNYWVVYFVASLVYTDLTGCLLYKALFSTYKWRTDLSKLQSADFIFSIKICVSLFVCGLPSIPAFNTLHTDLPHHIAAIAGKHDFGAFIELTETVLELNTIFQPSIHSQVNRLPRVPNVTAPPAPPLPPSNFSRPSFPHIEEGTHL